MTEVTDYSLVELYKRPCTHTPRALNYKPGTDRALLDLEPAKEVIFMGVVHLISRRPRCRTCERCGRLQLLGIDEGIPYRVEPLPLTVQAEIKAIIGGRITYGAHVGYVCYRDAGRMGLDVKWGRPPVFATHKCHLLATADDIDPGGVDATTAFIARVIAEQEHRDEPAVTETEVEALFSIADLLSGRVVAEVEPAPF